jgi:hypothetical protein
VDRQNDHLVAFTIKARKNVDQTQTNYLIHLQLWRTLYGAQIKFAIPEKDKLGRLHYHGIVQLNKGIKYKDMMNKSFSIWLRKLEENADIEAWTHYCRKDCPK